MDSLVFRLQPHTVHFPMATKYAEEWVRNHISDLWLSFLCGCTMTCTSYLISKLFAQSIAMGAPLRKFQARALNQKVFMAYVLSFWIALLEATRQQMFRNPQQNSSVSSLAHTNTDRVVQRRLEICNRKRISIHYRFRWDKNENGETHSSQRSERPNEYQNVV